MDSLKAILISMALILSAINGVSFAEEEQAEVATADQQTVTEDQSDDKTKKGDEEPECD